MRANFLPSISPSFQHPLPLRVLLWHPQPPFTCFMIQAKRYIQLAPSTGRQKYKSSQPTQCLQLRGAATVTAASTVAPAPSSRVSPPLEFTGAKKLGCVTISAAPSRYHYHRCWVKDLDPAVDLRNGRVRPCMKPNVYRRPACRATVFACAGVRRCNKHQVHTEIFFSFSTTI